MTDDNGLAALRLQIDEIDDQILTALAKRQQLSRKIAQRKAPGSNVYRPDREAKLMRQLIVKHDAVTPKLIYALMRHIISASIAEQKPDYCIGHSALAKQLAHDHAAGFLGLQHYPSADDAYDGLQNHEVDCLIVTDAECQDILNKLGHDYQAYIVARIPFFHHDDAPIGYVICRELPDLSGDDVALLRGSDGAIITSQPIGAEQALPSGDIIGIYANGISQIS